MRRLRYTLGSPFARIVRIVLDEKGLDYQHIEEITASSAEERLKDGPTLQVPAFSDGDLKLWDSTVIVDYLMAKYPNAAPPPGQPPLTETIHRPDREVEDKLLSATLNTLGESLVIVAQCKFVGVTADDNAYVARNASRVQYILDWVEPLTFSEQEGFFPGVISIQDIALACYLMYIDKRPIGIEWRVPNRPRNAALHDRLAARPSFSANPVWWFDVGVTGYQDDGTPIFGEPI